MAPKPLVAAAPIASELELVATASVSLTAITDESESNAPKCCEESTEGASGMCIPQAAALAATAGVWSHVGQTPSCSSDGNSQHCVRASASGIVAPLVPIRAYMSSEYLQLGQERASKE